MKYFVFADVHGHYDALKEALDQSGFDENNSEHMLISLGDNWDRGMQNIKVYHFLEDMRKKGKILIILGNHEKMLLDFLTENQFTLFNVKHNGLDTTIFEFAELQEEQRDMVMNSCFYDKLQQMVRLNYPNLKPLIVRMAYGYKIGDYILTHAGFSGPFMQLDNSANTKKFIKEFNGGEKHTFVFGHYSTKELNKTFLSLRSYDTFKYKNFVGIDAETVSSNKVNIYVFESNAAPIELNNGIFYDNIDFIK